MDRKKIKKNMIIQFTNYFIILLISCVSMVGCAGVNKIPLKHDVATTLADKTLEKTNYEKPDFSAMTAAKVAIPFASFTMISAGNKIIKTNNVEDPAHFVANKFSETLADKFNLTVAESTPKISNSDKINSLVELYSKADILVDVKTLGWNFCYFPTDWDSYRVMYTARLRLIDTSTNTVIAEDLCSYVPEYSNDAPSYDDLVNENAAGLKLQLHKAANFCLDYFNKNIIPE